MWFQPLTKGRYYFTYFFIIFSSWSGLIASSTDFLSATKKKSGTWNLVRRLMNSFSMWSSIIAGKLHWQRGSGFDCRRLEKRMKLVCLSVCYWEPDYRYFSSWSLFGTHQSGRSAIGMTSRNSKPRLLLSCGEHLSVDTDTRTQSDLGWVLGSELYSISTIFQ